jgi:cytochrome c553
MRPLVCTWAVIALMPLAGTTAGELTAQDLAAARKLYVAKCAKCHRFYEPTNYTEVNWQRWMESMSRKSKLKPPQQELLNRYLDAYRAGQLPHPPEAPARSPADRRPR